MVSRAKSPVYNLAEAKAHLSELVERASAGEIIVVARSGTPRARLVPLEKGRKELRVPGKGEGRFNMNFGSPRSECRSPKRNSSRIGLKPRGGVAAPRRARDSPKAAEGRKESGARDEGTPKSMFKTARGFDAALPEDVLAAFETVES